MKTEGIYAIAGDGGYIDFRCGKCNVHAELKTISPDEPTPSTESRNVVFLGFEAKCPKCKQEGFFKMIIGTAEKKGVTIKFDRNSG